MELTDSKLSRQMYSLGMQELAAKLKSSINSWHLQARAESGPFCHLASGKSPVGFRFGSTSQHNLLHFEYVRRTKTIHSRASFTLNGIGINLWQHSKENKSARLNRD